MPISVKEINKLREITGVGIMDCKKALLESEGDLEKAIENLRKKGTKVANKRKDCVANEGYVLGGVDNNGNFGAIVSIFCETDFVAKNETLQNFVKDVLDIAIKNKVESLSVLNDIKYNEKISVNERFIELIGSLGEKLELKYTFLSGEKIGFYNHFNNKISVLLEVRNYNLEKTDVLKNIAMQIAAMNPIEIKRENVSADIVNKELEIAKAQSKEAKTPEIAEKMAKGKLEKFFKENILLEQISIFDNKKTVLDYIKENGNFEIRKFKSVKTSN